MNAAEKLNIPKGLTVAFLAYYTLLCATLVYIFIHILKIYLYINLIK